MADLEWVAATPVSAPELRGRALEGGYEGNEDNSPLWIIRANFQGDLVPGKLAVEHNAAYIPWGGKENVVNEFEVCCAHVSKVQWMEDKDGHVPSNAIRGGKTADGEILYVGRAWQDGALTPGKIQPSHNGMYIPYGGQEIKKSDYEVFCQI